jgi:acetylornithine deacetylase/succinyl-diaminopimelate desuccinylase-like protein
MDPNHPQVLFASLWDAYPDQDLRIFVPDGHPKEGGLLAVLHGSDPRAKAILMLAHVDVVEAKREDWTRDPFSLIEENGYFYARGTNDMKAQAAIWVDNMIRFREEGFRPKRSIKLALTCGEETNSALNGAGWLATHEREAIDAEFALTEGTDGDLDAQGRRVMLAILAAEKTSQNFVLETTNPGGHSSRPVADNAIYHVVRAVDRVAGTQDDYVVRSGVFYHLILRRGIPSGQHVIIVIFIFHRMVDESRRVAAVS